MERVEAEMQNMRLNPMQKEKYLAELRADILAVRLGAKPEAMISGNKKMQAAAPAIREKDDQEYLQGMEKEMGFPLTEETKKTLLDSHHDKRAKSIKNNAHPSAEIRNEATQMEADTLKKKPIAMDRGEHNKGEQQYLAAMEKQFGAPLSSEAQEIYRQQYRGSLASHLQDKAQSNEDRGNVAGLMGIKLDDSHEYAGMQNTPKCAKPIKPMQGKSGSRFPS
jgi:hypothetical protein